MSILHDFGFLLPRVDQQTLQASALSPLNGGLLPPIASPGTNLVEVTPSTNEPTFPQENSVPDAARINENLTAACLDDVVVFSFYRTFTATLC